MNVLECIRARRSVRTFDETPLQPEDAAAILDFAQKLEAATIKTIEEGVMTGDLYLLSKLENKKKVGTEEFLLAVNDRLVAML